MVKTYPGTDTIEDDIRTTRRNIDDKIERIQERFSPGDVVDNVVDFARTNGGAVAGGISRTVKENPVPAAMIGAGIVWLALSSRAKNRATADADVISEEETTTDKLRERAAAVRDDVKERAGKVRREARSKAIRAKDTSGQFIHEHPILVGAAGVALGVAVAASLPRSWREDGIFGERADRVKQAAKEAAQKEGRKVQDAAKAAVKKAKTEAEAKAPSKESLKQDAAETAQAAGVSRPH